MGLIPSPLEGDRVRALRARQGNPTRHSREACPRESGERETTSASPVLPLAFTRTEYDPTNFRETVGEA